MYMWSGTRITAKANIHFDGFQLEAIEVQLQAIEIQLQAIEIQSGTPRLEASNVRLQNFSFR